MAQNWACFELKGLRVLSKRRRLSELSPEELATHVLAGDRAALARSITLIESTRDDHQVMAQEVLARVLPQTGRAVRVGLSGAPGVGKSTFTEAFGRYLTGTDKKVAVLAIDPSSARTGGSILGDKTRMEELSRDPNAFIRPSPASGTLGGVARRTREAMLLVEAAGFDVVIVETVGVGQSETSVADMVDMFILLLSPGGGDELQGIKRGIMELADMVIVNKADGDLLMPAKRSAAEYKGALHLMRPKYDGWTAEVLLTSALKNNGIAEVWEAITRFRGILDAAGDLAALRSSQSKAWMWTELRAGLLHLVHEAPAARAALPELESDVMAGRMTPTVAAQKLLKMVAAGLSARS
jgi:LAO/AO transport system kinase